MKLLIFDSESEAKNKNKEIADRIGCTGNITKYFTEIIYNILVNKWALIVFNNQENRLTQEEINNIVELTQEEAVNDGWIKNIEI